MTDDAGAIEGYWLTISELAKLRGVDKGGLSRRIARLVELGLLATRPAKGGRKLVNVAEFDRVTEENTDAVRALNGATGGMNTGAPQSAPGDPHLGREQARRAAYEADLKKLDLDERLGKLIPIEEARLAMERCAAEVVRVIDQMPAQAEDNAAAVAKDGTNGARNFLRQLARDQREALARAMSRLAEVAQAEEPEAA